ncbi:MAG TPA: alpha-glucuronidase family glycosyl hydrolase [Lysobacter sp.]
MRASPMVPAVSGVGDLATAEARKAKAWASRLLGIVAPATCLLALLGAAPVRAEDGYELWLRYHRTIAAAAPDRVQAYRGHASSLVAADHTPTQAATRAELLRGLGGLLGKAPMLAEAVRGDGALIVGTPASSPLIARLRLKTATLGREGYLIRSIVVDGHTATVIAANEDIGALYGAFHFLRLLQTGQSLDRLDLREVPKLRLRMLDHWDNLDGQVERGYAGASLWDWHKLPDYLDPRYTDYARANASLGINGTVLNNVNANAQSLTPMYLDKAAALADVLRPYGIRVFLSARFSAPVDIGGLKTADPLDPQVQKWWRAKADEIHARIPDFGGFLVKANSEGQPGPQDYGRSHAEGANMLADALAPHGGVVLWRAFVYSHEVPDDRASQAYNEFVPLDGKFRGNVMVQVKNGAIDFQPREPFHPLFGAMPGTPLMMEFQITKEYLGFATHLVYLGPLFEETLASDTQARGEGSSVARVIEGRLPGGVPGKALTGMAGVANIGADRNWSGSHFDQANWYAYGRLAWDPTLSSRAIAEDWVRITFSSDERFVTPVVDMMMGSREAAVDYMTPLGLHHLMARGHHYGPGPWVAGGPRADWTSVYYHRADHKGVGFDRSATGSNAVAQYAPPLARQFGDMGTVPEKFLLWFHHVPWDYRTSSGRLLWDELVHRYTKGVARVHAMRETWNGLGNYIDHERHAQVAAFLAIQEKEAQWWRDASIAYFQTFSGRPLAEGYAPPPHTLDYYESLSFPYAPGQ